MMNLQEFYILGEPIETELGECNFLTVKEYPNYFMDLQVVALTKNHIIGKYSDLNKDGSLKEFIDELHKVELYDIAVGIPDITISYIRLFNKLFRGEEVFQSVTKHTFDYYRRLVMTMNGLKEEIINPNPEIQRAIERSKRVKSQEGEKLEFADMVTSIVGYNGLTYDNIKDFTLYQFYMTYYRIAHIKNYDTSTLFATVAADKVKIDSWSKHINLFEDEDHTMSYNEFTNSIGKVVNE
ncbi:hypothetical protein [Cytobacillus praedii]|uniref:Uncharacterized protein n=1 Tax=Cytobacillus praedii TaxID=1742358 RepID=A0A4V2NTP7_9BACI|nr:hypothetical protein [Cytobacillus praedii]TCJ01084.1 hypothetical protein E0Y62_25800 [Cytobacillus praedii]